MTKCRIWVTLRQLWIGETKHQYRRLRTLVIGSRKGWGENGNA